MPEYTNAISHEGVSPVSTKIGETALANPESMYQDPFSKIAIEAQRRLNILDDGFLDEEYFEVRSERNRALESAENLDFELVRLGNTDWSMLVFLNSMHDKFKNVSTNTLSEYLGDDDSAYEYKAFRIRNIVADNAPGLLTSNIKTILDPSQPQWRRSSAHASMLLRTWSQSNVNDIQVDQVATALPVGNRLDYEPEDNLVMQSLDSMEEDELALYVRPGSMADVKERGIVNFGDLSMPARESLLMRRLYETVVKSTGRVEKEAASERNRTLEGEPVLQQGDLVHATSAEVFEQILPNGLQCGEAIEGLSRSAIKYPFTVSFLEVGNEIAEGTIMAEQLDLLRNEPYGPVNLILHRNESATKHTQGQKIGATYQRQIFGGVPSTEIKSIIIRQHDDMKSTTEKVVKSIVKNGFFIPVYSGDTGEPLFTSAQYDTLASNIAN